MQTLLVLAIDHARAPDGQAAETTPAEALEQAKAPTTLPVRTGRAISGVPTAAYLHRSDALRLGVDRFFDIGHGHTWSSHHFPSFYLQPVPVQFGISPPKRASQRPRAYCTDTVQYQNQIPVTGVK